MTATARKRDWRSLASKFMCGHPRTDENKTCRGDCRTCFNTREAKYRKRKRAKVRRRATDGDRYNARIGVLPFDESLLQMELLDRPRRSAIPLTIRTLALIDECREEYARAIGQFELFTPLPPTRDAE